MAGACTNVGWFNSIVWPPFIPQRYFPLHLHIQAPCIFYTFPPVCIVCYIFCCTFLPGATQLQVA